MTKVELKQLVCDAIDKRREDIISLGESVFAEPELGYKEYLTSQKIKTVFDSLGLAHRDNIAKTGIVAPIKGAQNKLKISIMGEMDAVVAPAHRCADPLTGAAHSCGHNAMCASLVGVAYAMLDTDVMSHLAGDVVLMAVPAEEYVEIEYRNNLRENGEISFLGGKQELVKLGEMDDIDIMVMQHSANNYDDYVADCGGRANGFVGKLVRYIGKEAHAGGAPHLGINALNAAELGLMGVAMQRETFKDEDHIRVHPIITKGGNLVNVVPSDVRIETYVRGANVGAIMDASAKVNRAFKAGGDAVGAETVITDLPGYLPVVTEPHLEDLMYQNLCELVGKNHTNRFGPGMSGSTDAGDISHLIPTIHASIGGAEGTFHSENFEIADKELAYIVSSKALAMMLVDLLADDAETGLEIKANFTPAMTKEEYLKNWGHM